ncbi:mitochondrial large subunit ribosomal protein-domain-containing protein [Corynascus similis CBS 632.67]
MLRPITLLRARAAPSRLILTQFVPSTPPLARAYSTPSATTTTTGATTVSNIPPTSSSASQESASSSPDPTPKPYYVRRTPSNQLAVYHLAKRGGNKKLTTIKKVEGDRARFRLALAQGLGLQEKGVVVNNLTGHVIIPGHRKEEVTGWLEKQGF